MVPVRQFEGDPTGSPEARFLNDSVKNKLLFLMHVKLP